MGCGASKSTGTTPDSSSEKTIGADEKVEEETKEEEKNEESIIKKHPPKPSQRLEEQAQTILKSEELTENELVISPNSTDQLPKEENSHEEEPSVVSPETNENEETK
ncbi:uncharacterized abhydrolase domain-containing protein DDB_G0269086-like [Centruroides vittatus]|uniref:uncharacterized abhydrolase domain-containing protein DDB_G0269086-like n=1 Tax=Centruroides vittatus TaxID=120091 RepID=UPI00350EFD9F